MVARRFIVNHNDSDFPVDYDTDDGYEVFKFQLFSLTNVPPDEQKIIGWGGDRAVSDDSDLITISEKLRLVSISEEEEEKSENSVEACSSAIAQSDEELARMLQAEEDALMFQQFVASDNGNEMKNRIMPYVAQVLMYEDPKRQEEARKTVPVLELEEKALVSLAKEGSFKPSRTEQDHAFLLQLLFWFKQSFRWVNAPSCDSCGNQTISHGMGTPLQSELNFGCSRVELYWCQSCSTITRFPRYNDPLKLVETRKGRCGEWANCFTLYCRAFGYESRLVLDFTDHVWTECFSQCFGRWMHLDPCEGIFDNPLLYEKGWGKKLNYIIAIAKDGVYDVTKRYTRKWHEVLSRRNITTEGALSAVLANITNDCRKGFTSQVLSTLEERDRNETEAIERDYHSKDYASTSLPGRQSGDKEWRISRSEFGSDDNRSLSSSSCPVRMCIDGHVTRIYNAFYPILHSCILNSLSKSRAVEILKMFRSIVVELRDSPFRTRKASIKRDSSSAKFFVDQMLPSFSELFEALSLKCELGMDGRVEIFLAGDPVKTSLALPVVFDGLGDVIHNCNICDNFSKDSLSLPLVKLNRICSGLVLASGEELPFGIATSAFDGIQNSKWEEPNGAKGCWIIYKVLDNKMQELVAYELMSANDAPERDPMDWVVEGSNDGGRSWHVIDKQSSQRFETRFQRKTFKVNSAGFLSTAFRFRFLKVLNNEETSRLQLGSIDLYARGS